MAPCLCQEARRARPEAPSINRCSPRPLAPSREPATVSRSKSPGSASSATPSSLALGKLSPRGPRGLSPRAVQAKRRLSTSAITAVLQHSCGRIRRPARRQGVASLPGDAGSPAPFGARPAELSRARGRRRVNPSPASPRAMTRRGALPRSGRLGHLMSRNRACAGRRVPAQEMEQVPARPPPDSVQDAARTRA